MKTDRRIKYTKMVLKEALIEILQERPVERVTVKEICDRADVNRSTFYVHYGSPQELLESICRELCEEISQKKKDFEDIQHKRPPKVHKRRREPSKGICVTKNGQAKRENDKTDKYSCIYFFCFS